MAAMIPEKTKSLHNFSLPPRLRWGSQKLLRCSSLDDDDADTDSDADRKRCSSSKKNKSRTSTHNKNKSASFHSHSSTRCEMISGDNQIEAIREKLMCDLRSEVDKMRAVILGNSHVDPSPPLPPVPPPETELRPWNLRTRRAACKDPAVPASEKKAVAKPSSVGRGGGGGDSGQSSKISIQLSRQEIEDDFMKMLGKKPPRKPKKRPRHVQRQLDTAFPGLWLSEITADLYKVDENPEYAGKSQK